MSTVTSYTLLSQLQVSSGIRVHGNVSAASDRYLPISWKPSIVALPSSATRKCRPLSVSCALPEAKPPFNVSPTALVHPSSPASGGEERWGIKEEDHHVRLWFHVPGLSKEDIHVRVDEDVLMIQRKKTSAKNDGRHDVGMFDVRLLVTGGYDKEKVEAKLKDGMFEVIIGKNALRRVIFVPIN